MMMMGRLESVRIWLKAFNPEIQVKIRRMEAFFTMEILIANDRE
jgi:hypothetical protein